MGGRIGKPCGSRTTLFPSQQRLYRKQSFCTPVKLPCIKLREPRSGLSLTIYFCSISLSPCHLPSSMAPINNSTRLLPSRKPRPQRPRGFFRDVRKEDAKLAALSVMGWLRHLWLLWLLWLLDVHGCLPWMAADAENCDGWNRRYPLDKRDAWQTRVFR